MRYGIVRSPSEQRRTTPRVLAHLPHARIRRNGSLSVFSPGTPRSNRASDLSGAAIYQVHVAIGATSLKSRSRYSARQLGQIISPAVYTIPNNLQSGRSVRPRTPKCFRFLPTIRKSQQSLGKLIGRWPSSAKVCEKTRCRVKSLKPSSPAIRGALSPALAINQHQRKQLRNSTASAPERNTTCSLVLRFSN